MRNKKNIATLLLVIALISAACGNQGEKESLSPLDYSLAEAISMGSLEAVKEALEDGADINQSYVENPSPRAVIPFEYATDLYASGNSNSRITQYLMEQGANLNFTIDDDMTPLIAAVVRDDVKECQEYLQYGADVAYPAKNGQTPIDAAAFNGAEKTTSILLENGAQVTENTLSLALEGRRGKGKLNYEAIQIFVKSLIEQGQEVELEPIEIAAITGDSKRVIELCSEGQLKEENLNWVGNNVAAFCDGDALAACVQNGFLIRGNDEYDSFDAPVQISAKYGNLSTVKWIIANWEQFEDGSPPKRSALNKAIAYNQVEVVSHLLSIGTPLELKSMDESDFPALLYAAENGDPELVRLLLAHDEFVSDFVILGGLSQAIQEDHYEVAALLMEALSSPKDGAQAAMEYISSNVDMLKLCVQYGADPINGDLLCKAVSEGYVEVAKYLVQAGTDVNFVNSNNEQPLGIAVRKGFFDIVHLLVENGADVNAVDETYGSILVISSLSSANITQYLAKHGANLNYQDEKGNTPLMFAVTNRRVRCVEVLITAGADVSLKNEKGLTAYAIAKKIADKSILELFE